MAVFLIPFFFMFVPMTAGIAISSHSASTNANNLQQQIQVLNQINENTTNQMNDIIKNMYSTDYTLKDKYDKMFTEYNKLKITIEQTTSEFSDHLRQIQLYGIYFIVVVFFLLLLKNFDLLKPFMEVIMYPFTYTYNLIIKNNNNKI